MDAKRELRNKLVETIDKILGTTVPRFKVFEETHYADVRDLSKESNQTVARFWEIDEAYKYAAARIKETR